MGIFAGLITHENSNYQDLTSYEELKRVSAELDQRGTVTVFDTDSFSPEDVSRWQVLARKFLVPVMDYRVKRFRKNSVRRCMRSVTRETRNELRRGLGVQAVKWLARNPNITSAHISLWTDALKSDAEWILIVEDDVQIVDANFVAKVEALVDYSESLHQQSIAAFLSGSFTRKQHMVTSLPCKQDEFRGVHFFVSEDRAWSDTVAATIYSRKFLEDFLSFLSKSWKITEATLPIDQLLDVFLIHSSSSPHPATTLHLDPAICKQQSLKP